MLIPTPLPLFNPRSHPLKFSNKKSISSQIKTLFNPHPSILPTKPKPQISFHLDSPPKPIIRIRSPKTRISLPSTKSSQKTNVSINHQQSSCVSEFMLNGNSVEMERIAVRDWLVKVVADLGLYRKVLYDTLHFVEEYRRVKKQTYGMKVVCVVVLYLVCKLEYQHHNSINQFMYLADGEITKEEFIDLQIDIMVTFKYKLSSPVTLYSRLIHHLHQFQSFQKQQTKPSIPSINLLSKYSHDSYKTLLKMLDAVLLSNIHQNYFLDSIVYLLIKMVSMGQLDGQKEERVFGKLYESYWKGRYVSIEVYRIQRNIGSVLEGLMASQKKGKNGRSKSQGVDKQTHCQQLKKIAQVIYESVSMEIGRY